MLSLSDFQKEFVNHLQKTEAPTFVTPAHQFMIYRKSVLGVLQKTLKNIYPVVQKLVGEDFFLMMADHYIESTPSTSPDTGCYGGTFAEFISSFPPIQTLAYLADVARLEWAYHCLFGADAKEIDIQQLEKYYETDAANIVFILPCESTLLTSCFPIHQIWQVNQPGYHGDSTILLKKETQYFYLIFRHHNEMRIDLLTEQEWQILAWIQQKHSIGEVCEKALVAYPEINMVNLLHDIVKRGWLTDFMLNIL